MPSILKSLGHHTCKSLCDLWSARFSNLLQCTCIYKSDQWLPITFHIWLRFSKLVLKNIHQKIRVSRDFSLWPLISALHLWSNKYNLGSIIYEASIFLAWLTKHWLSWKAKNFFFTINPLGTTFQKDFIQILFWIGINRDLLAHECDPYSLFNAIHTIVNPLWYVQVSGYNDMTKDS